MKAKVQTAPPCLVENLALWQCLCCGRAGGTVPFTHNSFLDCLDPIPPYPSPFPALLEVVPKPPSAVRLRCGCGAGAPPLARPLCQMSASRHTRRENEAQAFLLVPRKFIFSTCACRHSLSAKSSQHHHSSFGKVQV
jgi:hypothetical protein